MEAPSASILLGLPPIGDWGPVLNAWTNTGRTSRIRPVAVTPLYAFGVTFLLLRAVQLLVPLRTTEGEESIGMDITQHGERLVDHAT